MSKTKTIHFARPGQPFFKGQQVYNEDSEGMATPVGTYDRNVAPKSSQKIRPRFDVGKRRWRIELKEGEKLNDLVQACGLVHERGPKEGEVIKEANIHNDRDPFFQHEDLIINAERGVETLNEDNPIEKVQLRCIAADKRFQIRGEEANPAFAANTEFEVVDPNVEDIEDTKEMDDTVKAIKRLDSMDFEKMKQTARIMDINISDSATEKGVEKALFKKITDYKNQRVADNDRNIDLFLRISEESTEYINLRDVIARARRKNVIIKKNGKFMYQGIVLGSSYDEAVEFLSDKNHKDHRDSIINALE